MTKRTPVRFLLCLLAASAGAATATAGPGIMTGDIVESRFQSSAGELGIINVHTPAGAVLTVGVNGRKVRVRIEAVERDIVRTDSWFQATSL